MADQSGELKKYLTSQVQPTEFSIRPFYSRDGDFISYCWNPSEPFFTRRIDEYLTCYYSMSSKQVVGCKIKGIRFLLGKHLEIASGASGRPTIKSVSVIGRGLSRKPADLEEYERVWEHGHVEIEDPDMQPA